MNYYIYLLLVEIKHKENMDNMQKNQYQIELQISETL